MRGLWIFDDAEIAGGGQRFALRLARYAAESGQARVQMVCPADSVLAVWCQGAGLSVVDADFPPFHIAHRVLAAMARSHRLLRQVPAGELIVANSARVQAYVFGASRLGRRHASVVNVMHEQDSARRLSARSAYRRFGSLLVIGEAAASAYRDRIPGVTVHEANNFLLPDELATFAAVRREGLGEGRAVLGVLGRMIPEKGLVELVEQLAAAAVRPLWERLIVAALPQDEAYERRLRARVDELELRSAVEIGPRPATDVLAEVDALLVPSIGHEAQPTAIVEALAAGIPVILRSALWSSAYQDLPVSRYDSEDTLAAALDRPPIAAATLSALASRFGPEQFMAALERAS